MKVAQWFCHRPQDSPPELGRAHIFGRHLNSHSTCAFWLLAADKVCRYLRRPWDRLSLRTRVNHVRLRSAESREDDRLQTASWLLTGTPYFPLQVAVAFLSGWWIMKKLGQVESLWVWILPAFAMLVAMVHGPVIQLGGQASYSAISHFLGDGCRAQDHCFDQVVFTLPLYTGIAYSLGAVAGRIHAKTQNPLLHK
jgi:hypothetical protein